MLQFVIVTSILREIFENLDHLHVAAVITYKDSTTLENGRTFYGFDDVMHQESIAGMVNLDATTRFL